MSEQQQQPPAPAENTPNLHLDEVTREMVSKSELKKRQKKRENDAKKAEKAAAAAAAVPPGGGASGAPVARAQLDEEELTPNVCPSPYLSLCIGDRLIDLSLCG